MEFKAWPKIVRLENKRAPIFTEKIDGTNACIVIGFTDANDKTLYTHLTEVGPLSIWAQSRSRFITPDDDNYGFARWVQENGKALSQLGAGYHFGEWWGQGIQRGYGLTEKRFSLFNTRRWGPHNPNTPTCCHVVPMLPDWVRDAPGTTSDVKSFLQINGSVAVPGWSKPEGAVMYEPDTDTMFKIILDK